MSAHPEFDVYILADSVTGVSILNESLGRNRVTRPIKVLLELGEAGARAGCRTIDEAIAVADAIGESEHLRLAGVEGFEALMDGDDVRAFLGRLRETTTVLASRGCFDGAQEIIISAGSSELIEITAKELSGLALALPTRTVLRPGGYATNSIMTGYRKSMEIVGAVISRPEDGVAIANFGRRDVPCDEKLLSPLAAVTQGHVRTIENHAKVVCLYDQHATLAVDGAELSVGDYIIVSVTSPYRPAFATWRTIPLVDDSYNIIENLDVLY
jgi:D-serine dehydratase